MKKVQAVSGDLPGESARASLKPDTPSGACHTLAGSPGRIGPGLIEATVTVSVASTEAPMASPGRIGPGLIEAVRSEGVPNQPARDLPGESARASLKHCVASVVC